MIGVCLSLFGLASCVFCNRWVWPKTKTLTKGVGEAFLAILQEMKDRRLGLWVAIIGIAILVGGAVTGRLALLPRHAAQPLLAGGIVVFMFGVMGMIGKALVEMQQGEEEPPADGPAEPPAGD